MRAVAVVAAAALALASAQLTPIPPSRGEYSIGDATAPVLLEAYMDLMVRSAVLRAASFGPLRPGGGDPGGWWARVRLSACRSARIRWRRGLRCRRC